LYPCYATAGLISPSLPVVVKIMSCATGDDMVSCHSVLLQGSALKRLTSSKIGCNHV